MANITELLELPRPAKRPPYSEQLKDPRWEWVRSEIIQRDGYCCKICFRTRGLQVHHMEYVDGWLAWEYPFNYLITLCGRCHAIEHGIIADIDTFRQIGESRPVKSIYEIMLEMVQASIKMAENRSQWQRKGL